MTEVVCDCTERSSSEYNSEKHKKNDKKQYNTANDDDATVSTETHIPMNETQINICCWQITYRIVIFTVVPCILILSKFYYQLIHKRIALKGVLKFTLKQLQHVSV
jgi:hypothetical protein